MGSQEGKRRRRRRNVNADENAEEQSDDTSDENYDPLPDIEFTEDTDKEYNDSCDYNSLEHELMDILDSSSDDA